MMLLPKTVGPFTLIRKLGTGGVAESYHGILDEQGSQGVLVRRILPYVLHDPTRMASTEARVRDLLGVRHPFLVRVLDWVADGDDRFIVEDLVDGVSLERVLRWCRENDSPIPHNVYLNLATQICNGLEALHGRPGKGTGSGSVLHLALKPSAIQITREGKVVLGSYGLSRSPTVLSHGGMQNPVPVRVEYLSPEQTHPDQKLTPASDIFSLGSLLYEMLTLETLFRSDNNLQTINRIRRVEITTQLLSAREVMPGLDKVLYRALSLNPRHRYQRAFVLREDLRGLMAGYSFSTIVDDTRHFISQLIDSPAAAPPESRPLTPAPAPFPIADSPASETLAASSALMAGAAAAAQSLADEEQTEAPHPVENLLPLEDLLGSPQEQPTESASGDDLSAIRAEIFSNDPHSTAEAAPLSEKLAEPPPAPVAAALPELPPAPDLPPAPTVASLHAMDPVDLPEPGDFAEASAEQVTTIREAPVEGEVTDVVPSPPFDPSSPAGEVPLPTPILAEDEVFDPNSTAGFLRGHQPDAPLPPSVEPSPRLKNAPPPVSITERAPPPVRPRRVEPSPVEDDFYDDEPLPKRSKAPLIALLAAAGFLVVCGGGGATIWSLYNSLSADSAIATAPPAPPVPVVGEATPAVADAEPPPQVDDVVEVAPEPVAAAPVRSEPVRSNPVRSEPVATSRPTTSSVRSTSTTPAGSARTVDEDDPLAFLDEGDGSEEDPIEAEPVNLDRYSRSSTSGNLNPSDILTLETVDISDTDYTRSRALLLMNAQNSNDTRATQQYLGELMQKPENQYNPVYLTDYARYYANRGSFTRALEQANLAERHWQRLPSELIFLKKAEIYEIQAASYQGLFYDSESDTDLLLKSIRHWEKLKEHTQGRDNSSVSRAEAELEKLLDIQRRLEN